MNNMDSSNPLAVNLVASLVRVSHLVRTVAVLSIPYATHYISTSPYQAVDRSGR